MFCMGHTSALQARYTFRTFGAQGLADGSHPIFTHSEQRKTQNEKIYLNSLFSVGDSLQGPHLFPFRTEKLSPVKPMIALIAKVGCRQHQAMNFFVQINFLMPMIACVVRSGASQGRTPTWVGGGGVASKVSRL